MTQSKLYNFLVDPKYRIWRHVLLISIFVLISTRQMTQVYLGSYTVLGNYLYLIRFLTAVIYVLVIYINLYFFVPRFLLNKKYRSYFIGLFFLTLSLVVYFVGHEYIVRSIFGIINRDNYFSLITIVSNLSFFVTSFICIMSTSVSMLFKKQLEENLRANEMEQKHIESELDRLKEQISPSFLSDILNKASILTKTDPEKASDMLMRIGKLLRYQLYDCNQDKVLLSAEIKFLKEYLDLEQMYCDRFKYEFIVDNTIKELFIPPLLLISFVQSAINKREEQISLYLNLTLVGNDLIFICQSTSKKLLLEVELFAIKKRLNLLYPDNYSLSISEGKTKLQLNNVLEL